MYTYYVHTLDKVVDGDTIDVTIDLGFDIRYSARVRLAGIDTPESRTRNLAEKELGLKSKQYLKDVLESAETIIIRTEKPDSTGKYGRILGWLFINNETVSINHKMIDLGYAWSYDGGTKNKDLDFLISKQKGMS